MMQTRNSIYEAGIFSGEALNAANTTKLGHLLPTGPGVYELLLRINIVLTIGTGTGAITNGILNYIRRILLEADNGEQFVVNLPARTLVEWANVLSRTMPDFDQIAASTATYRVNIPVYFSPKFGTSERESDTIIDTSRYNSLKFEIELGPLDDLFTSKGTASVAVTADLDFTRSKDDWNSRYPDRANYSPILGYISYMGETPVDANSKTSMDLTRSEDLYYARLLLHTGTSGTAGMLFQGVNSNAVIDKLSIKEAGGDWGLDMIWAMLQTRCKMRYETETIRTGVACVDFVSAGSILAALKSQKSNLRLAWTNQSGVGANYYVSCSQQAIRDLKPAKAA